MPPLRLMKSRSGSSRSLYCAAYRNTRDHLLRVLSSTLPRSAVPRIRAANGSGCADRRIPSQVQCPRCTVDCPTLQCPRHDGFENDAQIAINRVSVMACLNHFPFTLQYEANWPSSLRSKTEWRLVHRRAWSEFRKVGLRIELNVHEIIAQLWCRLPRNSTAGIYVPHRISGCFEFN